MHWNRINSFFKHCRSIMDDHLHAFIVFGSVARGLNKKDSDIDILILIENTGNRKMACSLQSLVWEHNRHDGPNLSVNLAGSDDFIAHLAQGDPFSVSIALEGECLLKSSLFENARQMVRDNNLLPDKKVIVEHLHANAAQGARELVKEMLPQISERMYMVITGFLTACRIEQHGIESWRDLTVYSSSDKLTEDFYEIWGACGRKIVETILDVRKGKWNKMRPLKDIMELISDPESEKRLPALFEKNSAPDSDSALRKWR